MNAASGRPPDSGGSPDPADPPDSGGPPDPAARPSTLKRAGIWAIGAVASAIIAVLASIWIPALTGKISDNGPPLTAVRISGVESSEPPSHRTELLAPGLAPAPKPGGWALYVADIDRLPQQVQHVSDCAALKRIGTAAGGVEYKPRYPDPMVITLHGDANDGLSIIDMRVRVVKRGAPAPDGAVLKCVGAWAGPSSPVGLQADLTSGEIIPIQWFGVGRFDPEDAPSKSPGGYVQIPEPPYRGRSIPAFSDGFSIDLEKNEFVTLKIDLRPAIMLTEWEIEIRVATVDGVSTVTIKDGDKSFRTPGVRRDQDFKIQRSITY